MSRGHQPDPDRGHPHNENLKKMKNAKKPLANKQNPKF